MFFFKLLDYVDINVHIFKLNCIDLVLLPYYYINHVFYSETSL